MTNVRKVFVDTETGVDYLLASSNMTGRCAVTVSSSDGEKLYEGAQAEELVAGLSLENWQPISAEAFEAEAGAPPRRST